MKQILHRLSFIVAIATAVTLTSCSKSDDNNPTPNPDPTRAQLLTAKSWIMTAMVYSEGGVDINVYGDLPACYADNEWAFLSNGNVEEREGATKCDPSDPNIYDSGTWALESNDTKLRIILTGEEVFLHDITEFTATKLATKVTDSRGGVYSFTFTAK